MDFYGVEISKMSVREINRLFRQHDDSRLWPICGRFNAVERAIRRAKWFQAETGQTFDSVSYAQFLDEEIGRIVNAAV